MKLAVIIWALGCALSVKAISQQEVIAAVLIGEAGGEGRKGMEAVLEVIHTRAREQHKLPYHVVTERFQFACLNHVSQATLVQLGRRHPRWAEAVRLVSRSVQTNWTHGTNHYHEVTIHPGWKNRICRVGRHIFYSFT